MQKQSLWLITFLTGLVTFLGSFGTYLVGHVDNPCTYLDRETLGHIALISASALGTMVAALNYQLPRSPGQYTDRVSDTKLNEINKGE